MRKNIFVFPILLKIKCDEAFHKTFAYPKCSFKIYSLNAPWRFCLKETSLFFRLSIEFSCEMDFKYYPMDTQICAMNLESCMSHRNLLMKTYFL